MDQKIHPALTVSNIKSHIPLVLEKDSPHYNTWSTLFSVHCQAFEVQDHLSPRPHPAPTESDAATLAAAATAETLWRRLDALVLQWIYATISQPLLHAILKPGQSAHDAWQAIHEEFNDNQTTRAIFLGQEFATLSLDNFASMADYCQRAKDLATQLGSLGSPVDNCLLVTKILTGLPEQYDSISTVLQNRDPLPDFNEVRSRLNMEEQKKKRQTTRAAQQSATALAATNSSTAQQPYFNPERGRGRHRGRGRGRGRSSSYRGRGSSFSNTQQQTHPYIVFPTNWTQAQWAGLLQQPTQNHSATSNSPPCPYPSKQPTGQGILGPRPDQAYHTGYTPTDIEQALYTMSLNPPDHGVMDTGASSHSANEQGPQNSSAYPPMQ